MPRICPRLLRHLLRRPFRHDLPALVAAFRAQVDDPVGRLDDLQIVFDDDYRVALLDEGVEDFEELAHVLEVEAGGGLVEDVESLPRRPARQFLGELDALGFAAAQGRRLLADLDVAEADLLRSEEHTSELQSLMRISYAV